MPPLLEQLARAIHERYRRNQAGRKPAGDPAMRSWADLAEDLKESNRRQAAHIPVKLEALGYGLRPAGPGAASLVLSPEQVERLAVMEHERWNQDRLDQGWRFGPVRDPDHKITPYLVPYAELPEDAKQWDREAVEAIPELLALARLEAFRLE
jgi:hypothetical protein